MAQSAGSTTKDNPNLSVLEHLNGRKGLKGKVEAVCTWDVFPFIFRTRKNGLRILSVAQEWQTVVTGIIIILAVYADILRRRT